MSKRTLRIPKVPKAARLDRTLTAILAGHHSRTEIARLIRDGRVLLNGAPAKPATEVAQGDSVTVEIPPPSPSDVEPEDLPLGIVFEDEHLAVVDKPAGMVTHPAGALRTGTLVNALLFHIRDLSGIGGVLRPGIVHRLDKGTSGLLVVAKDDESHRRLAAQLESRTLKRTYEAIAWGSVSPDTFSVDVPIARHPRDRKRMAVVEGGKEARSHVRVLYRTEMASHLEVKLETGRTHQIRVHLQHVGHPLVGDSSYGGRRRAIRSAPLAVRRRADVLIGRIDRPALHARRLVLAHPFSGQRLTFESPLPADFRAALAEVRAGAFP
jgi:23S rRNA pseudouridine1911/1915/1917 synthase